jgi:tRNA threonylcarbamoyladenosine biosynthesis protein TsaE
MTGIFYTNNSLETAKLGEEFSKEIKNGGIIFLYGDLGAGKTTFVQGVAKGLGIKRRITSPTFIIVRSYREENFYHVDLYRIESERDIEGLGIEEIFKDSRNIAAIEWPEKIKEILPKKRTEIFFSYLDDQKRKIEIKKYD